MSPLDMPSRLKGIETFDPYRAPQNWHPTLDMPSRLKGIETVPIIVATNLFDVFGYAFPFEGN